MKVIYVMKDICRSGGAKNIYDILNHLQVTGKYNCELVYLTGKTDWYGKVFFGLKQFTMIEDLINYLKDNNCIKVATWWETADWVYQSGGGYYFVQDIESSYYHTKEMRDKVLKTYELDLQHITINNFQKMVLKLVYHKEALNIDLAIDYDIFKDLCFGREQSLLYCYRSSHLKNPALFEDAMKLIHRDSALKNLIVYNYGLETTAYANHNLIDITDEKLVKLMNKAKIFLSTSVHEGFCMPILEAMACGAVVITTRSNGNMTFCIDNVNCLFAETPMEIKYAIKKLLNDPILWQRLQNNAKITVNNYTWDKVIFKLDKLFSNFKPLPKKVKKSYNPSISWVLLDDITPDIYNTCSERAHILNNGLKNSIISSTTKILNEMDIIIYQNRFEGHDIAYVNKYKAKKFFILDLTEQFWKKQFVYTTEFQKSLCIKMIHAVDIIMVPNEKIQKALKDDFGIIAKVVRNVDELETIIKEVKPKC